MIKIVFDNSPNNNNNNNYHKINKIKQRKDETWIEKVAFYYPRGVKNSLGSRDWENDPEGEYKTVAALLGVIGVVGVPLTVICSPPAVAIRAAAKPNLN